MYSLRNVERRPVLCFFKRIEGGLFYQKNKKKSLRKSPSLRPPLDRGFTARHPHISPSQASPRVSRRFRVAERVQDSIWPGPSHVRDRAC